MPLFGNTVTEPDLWLHSTHQNSTRRHQCIQENCNI